MSHKGLPRQLAIAIADKIANEAFKASAASDYWLNSTKVKGVRTARIRCAGSQEAINAWHSAIAEVIAPIKNSPDFKVYSRPFYRNPVMHSGKRNTIKIWYASQPGVKLPEHEM